MSKLTKEERRQAYKEALKIYKRQGLFNYVQTWDGGERFATSGLCLAMTIVFGRRWFEENLTLADDFPELIEQDTPKSEKDYWWKDIGERGYLTRVSLLFTAIKRTEL